MFIIQNWLLVRVSIPIYMSIHVAVGGIYIHYIKTSLHNRCVEHTCMNVLRPYLYYQYMIVSSHLCTCDHEIMNIMYE